MKVTGPGKIQSRSVKKSSKAGAADGAAFRSALNEDAGALDSAASVGGAGPVTGVGALLALQETQEIKNAPDATDGRSKGLARAEDMLSVLEEIRRGILLGAIPASDLRKLADSARKDRGHTGDSRLDAILEDIELRAEVELAKLGY